METKEKKQQTESFHIAKSDAAGKTPYNVLERDHFVR